MNVIYPTWMKSSDKKLKKIVKNEIEAEAFKKEIEKYEASIEKTGSCSKPAPQAPEQTPSKNQGGNTDSGSTGSDSNAPINTADFASKTKTELIAFLVEKGQDEKALKKLNKDQLIAKIGELGK